MKEFDRCQRCGRKLKNPEHRKLGFGPNCYKKFISSRHKKKSIIKVVENDRIPTTISKR